MPADKGVGGVDPIQYACVDDVNIFKVQGRGSMNNVHLFVSICKEIASSNNKKIIVDFKDCIGMDSTFMGALVSTREEFLKVDGELILIQVDEKLKALLDMLGVLELVPINNNLCVPEDLKLNPIPNFSISDMERVSIIHKAHKELVRACPDNQSKFGNFLKALESEISDM